MQTHPVVKISNSALKLADVGPSAEINARVHPRVKVYYIIGAVGAMGTIAIHSRVDPDVTKRSTCDILRVSLCDVAMFPNPLIYSRVDPCIIY